MFSPEMLRQKLNYMHNNPVRADLARTPSEYAYSSYRNYELGDEALIEIDKDWS
jgi:REP-associated tyrosine transposase